jgi:hypothetical protein
MLSEVETLPEDTRKLVVYLHWDEDRDYGFLTSTFTNFYIPPSLLWFRPKTFIR